MKEKFYEEITRFVSALSTQMRFSSNSLLELFTQDESTLLMLVLNSCVQADYSSTTLKQAWENGVELLPGNYGLGKDDKKLIKDFGNGLGTTDIEGQIKHCTLFEEQFSYKVKEIKEENHQKVKLYKTLGVFSGLALALFII